VVEIVASRCGFLLGPPGLGGLKGGGCLVDSGSRVSDSAR